jgi:hypothetical protein
MEPNVQLLDRAADAQACVFREIILGKEFAAALVSFVLGDTETATATAVNLVRVTSADIDTVVLADLDNTPLGAIAVLAVVGSDHAYGISRAKEGKGSEEGGRDLHGDDGRKI